MRGLYTAFIICLTLSVGCVSVSPRGEKVYREGSKGYQRKAAQFALTEAEAKERLAGFIPPSTQLQHDDRLRVIRVPMESQFIVGESYYFQTGRNKQPVDPSKNPRDYYVNGHTGEVELRPGLQPWEGSGNEGQ